MAKITLNKDIKVMRPESYKGMLQTTEMYGQICIQKYSPYGLNQEEEDEEEEERSARYIFNIPTGFVTNKLSKIFSMSSFWYLLT